MTSRICELASTGECRGDVVGHHDDYTKPDEIRWLCRSHHALWHIKHGHAPGWDPDVTVPRKTKRVTGVITLKLKQQIREIAAREHRSEGDIVRLALEAYIAQANRRAEALQDHDRREVAI